VRSLFREVAVFIIVSINMHMYMCCVPQEGSVGPEQLSGRLVKRNVSLFL
jgi:hypothetical protein